jgi:hypothetical protein
MVKILRHGKYVLENGLTVLITSRNANIAIGHVYINGQEHSNRLTWHPKTGRILEKGYPSDYNIKGHKQKTCLKKEGPECFSMDPFLGSYLLLPPSYMREGHVNEN